MQPNKKNDSASAPAKPILGQLIACSIALGIMAFGAWSLLGQSAPYHPESYEENSVTREASDLTSVSESN